ncbi:YALI0D09999p [Yarrowia lipolytica CLIB122]|uniref:Vacuolar-sorting protein SNF7 n=2 Tax=Yarrowia lipolytica TaxID=4952 RepID=Q6C9M2_YARLI|nr:YALI0D09999p [Yarrowia lipolytica CLIB122]AOW03858.1 hypothetical protein YALI1_D12646g [Yarrowia lipolytica]KAB8283085.1 Snf7-domain-containing protein [Yarrowia lipolytica]KAE8169992.1 Snf7-domain-containing protein [Yarrowia lipolytica]KAJ8054568.1 Snf7-domain-containing protein [Yarrowia lipolytica]RMI99701.1 Snf7-domain-containing protein [Yarrowia lipolytica]|eukprot:XP_502640.1 YALI0D09999p [Yarrowia lipolytica CLIB122]
MSTMLKSVLNSPFFSDNRRKSLYGNFRRLKTTNTEGYEANITAWKSVILDFCRSNHHVTLTTGPKLLNDLILAPHGKPQGLDIVLDQLQEQEAITDLNTYLGRFYMDICGTRPSGIASMVSWGVASLMRSSGMVKNPLENASNGPGTLKERTFVVSDLVQEAAETAVDYKGYVGSIYTFGELVCVIQKSQKGYNAVDAKCILSRLYSTGKCSISPGTDMVDVSNCPVHYDITVIKFGDGKDPVTEQDRSIATLKQTMNDIQTKITTIETRIEECTKEAKRYLQNKNKNTALSYLKMRKLNEKSLENASSSLVKLEEVMLAIDSAVTSQQVVGQLESSSELIKRINKEIGGAERVNKVMDEFDEQKSLSREIQDALEQDNVPEEEIDDELALMEAQEMAKKGEKDDLVDRLADQFGELKIPTTTPSAETKSEELNATRPEAPLQA